MRCSTIKGREPLCTGTATLMLIYPDPETHEETREPVCTPCGDGFVRRPRLKGRTVPLHVHTPATNTLITGGHRLIDGARTTGEFQCFDCKITGNTHSFQAGVTGCPARPESLELWIDQDTAATADAPTRAARSAEHYRSYAMRVGLPIEDWRPVTGDPAYCAFFTFRDREYGVRYGLARHALMACKLPNRGRPEPELVNVEDKDNYQQVVFHFHGLVNQYESTYFATWTPDREYIILYAPEGQISAMLRIDLDGTGTREWRLGIVTDAVCDAFGAVADIKFSSYIYE